MTTCYVAPDWGMALRISGELDAEFNEPGEEVRHAGPWIWKHAHGTIFAITSPRFPAEWNGRLLALNEKVVGSGEQIARLAPHQNPEFVQAVMLSMLAYQSRPKE